MREVGTLLARFPGPVRVPVSRLKILVLLVAGVGLTAFSVHLLMRAIDAWSSEVIWASASILVCGTLAARGVLLLLPGRAGLTLDADGFAISRILQRDRYAWRDASNFRIEDEYGAAKLRLVAFDLVEAGPRRTTITLALPGNYPLSDDDLAALMTQWRERALARPCTTSVPHIGAAGRRP